MVLGNTFAPGATHTTTLIAVGVAVAILHPVDRFVRRAISRLLYGRRDDPYAVLTRQGRLLEQATDPMSVLPSFAAALVDGLKVPYTAIVLREADGLSSVAAEHGRRAGEPERFPMTVHGRDVGDLLVAPRRPGDQFTAAEVRLLRDLATQAGQAAVAYSSMLALQRARERLVLAREEERRRLRRDLHDGVASALLGARMLTQAASDTARSAASNAAINIASHTANNAASDTASNPATDTARDTASDTASETATETARDTASDTASETATETASETVRLAALLDILATELDTCTAEVRSLIDGLRPAALDDGLEPALRALTERLPDPAPRFSIHVDGDLADLPAAVEVATYRIVSEAVTNVVKHAHAAHCSVKLTRDQSKLELTVSDDGSGFADSAKFNSAEFNSAEFNSSEFNSAEVSGVGLSSIRSRIEELGGRCDIASTAEGTRLHVVLPLRGLAPLQG
jgi:signal transduction histidine kinase